MELKFLSIKEICEVLDLCPNVVGDLIKSGELKGYKFKGSYRVEQKDLDKFIKDCIVDNAKG